MFTPITIVVLALAWLLFVGLLLSSRVRRFAAAALSRLVRVKARLAAAWESATTEKVTEWVDKMARPAQVHRRTRVGVARRGIAVIQWTTPAAAEVRGRAVHTGWIVGAKRHALAMWAGIRQLR